MTDADITTPGKRAHPVAKRHTLRAIAVFEAVNGISALAAIVGVLDLMHRDVRHLAMELIGHFGLHPDARYPEIILHYADLLTGANVHSLVALALAYMLVRLSEAYGLWNDLVWGEWLGALSGALYVPFEISHLLHRPSGIKLSVLLGNIFVVGFLVLQLWHRRRHVARR